MRKRTLCVLVFAFLHVLLTVSLTIATFGAVMEGFDGGQIADPRRVALLMAAVDVLSWPLSSVARPTMSGPSQYVVLYVNGLLWAVALLCAHLAIRRVRLSQFARVTSVV